MRKGFLFIIWMSVCWMTVSFLSCGKGRTSDAFLQADSLNKQAYEVRYKDWHLSEKLALEALEAVREAHFRLEEIYAKAMDFEAKEQFTKAFCERIFLLKKDEKCDTIE